MFAIKVFLIVFAFVHRCSGLDLFEEAKSDVAQDDARDEMLYAKHNVPPGDYMYNFAIESFNKTVNDHKANILLAYQYRLRGSGLCGRIKFRQCLRESAPLIPLNDRCLLPEGVCDPHERYSRVGGFCNNLKHPQAGIANAPYARFLDAVYADDISRIKRAVDGDELLNPRVLGNMVEEAEPFKCDTVKCGHDVNNAIGMMFSQMIAHDTTRRMVVEQKGNSSNGIKCCDESYSSPLPPNETHSGCIPITLPKNDPFYAEKGIFCQSYVRMQPTLLKNCKIKYRHRNTVSSFLDLNNIYGDLPSDLAPLRESFGGLFKMDSLNLTPSTADGTNIAGDFQFVQNTGLILIHTIFYRFHNMIARGLGVLHPAWTNDQLFYETRRIVIAVYQHIVYHDWLPVVLEKKVLRAYKLTCDGKCDKYDPEIDATTTIEYATSAFKWFHPNVPTFLHLVDAHDRWIGKVPFSDTYLNFTLLKNGNYLNLLRGLLKHKQRMKRVGYSGELRNLFLKLKYRGSEAGADNMIIDVMRDRDGGSAPFIDYYPLCGYKKIKSWSDLEDDFEKEHFKVLRRLYKDVRDIEIMVAVLFEKRKANYMSKISGCLTAEQFHRYKYGDRFFYSHPDRFSKDQLHEIKKMTFARLVCMTTGVERVPKKGFVSISKNNPYVDCNKFKPFNLSPF